MTFLRALPCLAFCACLGAQDLVLKPQGGGDLRIGGTQYRFELTDLGSAPPKGGLPGAVKLEGNLVPRDMGRPFRMSLTVLKTGSLYLLYIYRKAPDGYPDTWSPAMKAPLRTRIHVLKLEDRPGGRIELRCGGVLTGVIAKKPQESTWSGTLWAVFPGG